MSNHDDAVFVRNFSMVLVGLCVVGIMAFILAKIVNRSFQETQSPSETVASRIAPMGRVNTGTEVLEMEKPAASAPAPAAAATSVAVAAADSADPGKATYDKVCFACHAQGIAGAPKYADAAAWAERVSRGREANVANAINGYTGSAGMMPAKGGNPTLSDAEVAAAVDYMLAAVGVDSPTAAATEVPPPAAVDLPEAAVASTAQEDIAPATADNGRGKEVYDSACFVCHTPGAAGAPKLGDAAAWATRIEKGIDALNHNAINGYMGSAGMMPPKGGRPDFSDDDVKAAVDYMVANSK